MQLFAIFFLLTGVAASSTGTDGHMGKGGSGVFHAVRAALGLKELLKAKDAKPVKLRSAAPNATMTEAEAVRELFVRMDADGNGAITTSEVAPWMKAVGKEPTEESLQAWINRLDSDGSGAIEFPEFVDGADEVGDDAANKEDFDAMDKDGNGLISAAETRDVMVQVYKLSGLQLTDAQLDLAVDEFIRKADIDGDGHISYSEYLKMGKS